MRGRKKCERRISAEYPRPGAQISGTPPWGGIVEDFLPILFTIPVAFALTAPAWILLDAAFGYVILWKNW
jgi:hypothetical protein